MNRSDQQTIDPSPLMQLTTGYWASQAFLTANRIGLFELLAKGPLSAEQAASALTMQARPLGLLLNTCVGLGLLDKQDGKFANTPLSATFLVPGSNAYMGNAVRYADNLYQTWGHLEQALQDGKPPMPAEDYLGKDPQKTRHFVYGMHNRALGIGAALVETVDLTGRRQLLDIGGGPGTYSALFVRRYPGLSARVIDLPGVVALANEILGEMGSAEQVTTLAGDYHDTPFPAGNDVVLISGVFHRESAANCQQLIRKSRDSLDEGGMLVVSDVFADAGGASPLFATLFGLNMMLTAADGGVHADADVALWIKESGFSDISIRELPPPMPHRAIIAIKE